MPSGGGLRNRLRWPSLRLQADSDKCTNCLTCTRNCPMSLAVDQMVQQEDMENSECILCGNCVDGCPTDAISFCFKRG